MRAVYLDEISRHFEIALHGQCNVVDLRIEIKEDKIQVMFNELHRRSVTGLYGASFLGLLVSPVPRRCVLSIITMHLFGFRRVLKLSSIGAFTLSSKHAKKCQTGAWPRCYQGQLRITGRNANSKTFQIEV